MLALALRVLLPAELSAGSRMGDGYAVITKKSNTRPVTKARLKRLLTGGAVTWSGGGRMSLLLGPVNEPARVAALKDLADMTEADYNKNVMRLTFLGHADSIPATMPTTIMIRQLVQVNPLAVGIVPPAEVTDAVNNVTLA